MSVKVANQLFNRRVLIDFIKDDFEISDFSKLKLNYKERTNESKVRDLIKYYYDILNKNYRNEYVYKNTLLNKIVFGIHSPNTTTALSEVTINNSRLDLLIINGEARAYEIKTELDTLDKLEDQVSDYQKAFEYVSVVTSDKHIKSVLNKYSDSHVGIYRLNKDNTMTQIKKEISFTGEIDINYLIPLLRKNELKNIVLNLGQPVPDGSDFTFRSDCAKILLQESQSEVYSLILKELKRRGEKNTNLIKKIPEEIKFLVYTSNLSDDYCKLLLEKLEANI